MRLLKGLLLLGGLLPGVWASAVAAQVTEREVRDCVAIAAAEARLACYDAIGKRVAAMEQAAKQGGKWRVASKETKFSDKPDVYLSLPAEDTVVDLLAGEVRPVLWLSCAEGKMIGYINFGFTIGGGKKQLEYRIDGSQPRSASLATSSDFQGLGNWQDSAQLIATLKSWFGAREFLIRTVSISNDPMVATFDITGIETAVAPLRESCGW